MPINPDFLDAGLQLVLGNPRKALKVAMKMLATGAIPLPVNGLAGLAELTRPAAPSAPSLTHQARDNTRRMWPEFVKRDSGVFIILGQKGSGKTSLMLRLAEDIDRPTFCLGIDGDLLPDWIEEIKPDEVDRLTNDTCLIIDDASLVYGTGDYHSKAALMLAELINVLARQQHKIVILNSHRSAILQRQLVEPDVLFLKPASLMFEDNEREGMTKRFQRAQEELFDHIPESQWTSHVYCFTHSWRGALYYEKPTFWNSRISRNKA